MPTYCGIKETNISGIPSLGIMDRNPPRHDTIISLRMTTKEPTIRKGQRIPYIKATRKEIAQRIEVAAMLLSCGFDKSQIHLAFRKRYGVEWRQTDRYMARARGEARAPYHPRTIANRVLRITSLEFRRLRTGGYSPAQS